MLDLKDRRIGELSGGQQQRVFLARALAQQADVIGILVGILCPVVGSYPIVQRMALYGDVIAHAVLPGLSLSFFLGAIFLHSLHWKITSDRSK